MADSVRYRLTLQRPHAHRVEVEARFPSTGAPALDVCLPVWTPGSYLVREYARHLQDVTAQTPAGKPLPLQRVDKRTFRVTTEGGGEVVLRYRVYANDLSVRTSHFDGTHAALNGACIFLYSENLRSLQHRVELVAPTGWRTFVALPTDGADFVAADYDELVDSPFEVGPHQPVEFTAAGVPHQLVVWGDAQLDLPRLSQDLARICAQEATLFGGLPLRRYLFLVYLTEKGRGGLEHANSTALLFPRSNLASPKGWEDFLTLAAHEYFHLWNVKRIKPRAFVPLDYSQEQYTRLLWAFEGMTSYYDNLLVRRAGLMGAQRYLVKLGETLTALHSTPGRKAQTLSDASLVAWIKHYRPDESSVNTAISYYLKGEVVAALLDLTLRRLTENRRSLDDVLRLLWERYGDGRGVPEDGVEAAASEVAGSSLAPFFDRALRSTEELDYSPFAHVGLEVRFRAKESPSDKGGTPPRARAEERAGGWLGITTRGGATVATVLEGSPAMEAGLYPEDELVALDGVRVDAGGLQSRSDDRRPGERLSLTVFRRDRLVELPITLGARPLDAAYLARVENPSEGQRTAFAAWLGAQWEDPSPT